MFKRIIIRSKEDIDLVNVDNPFAIISISDPDDRVSPEITSRAKRCLFLKFLDTDLTKFTAGENLLPRCFNEKLGKSVGEFITLVLNDEIRTLLIHCEVGISRSPSIAMAICDAFELSREIMDWRFNIHSKPLNQHVYNITHRCLTDGKT